jgi:GH25 family lysozyme M1 (1,4-beta-N-acetylmuramidase)
MINSQVVLVDVSFWQDSDYTPYKIDFVKMRSRGVDGAILRAGQNQWIDEDYVDYSNAADLAGMPRGAYWYFDSRSSPESQVSKFSDALAGKPLPKLGLWGDYEEDYGGAWGGAAHFKVFMDTLRARFPSLIVGVYTGYYYWLEHTTYLQREGFKTYPLWIARYNVTNPIIPYPWTNYVFWQYTDNGDGLYFGVESKELDMNIFKGPFDDYKRFFLLGDITPVEPPPQGEFGMFKVYSNTYKMSLRRTNEVAGAFIKYIPIGTIMKADSIVPQLSGGMAGDKWAHIVEAGGVTEDGWIAVVHNGVVYCKYEEILTGTPHVLEVFVDGVLEYRKDF